MDALITASQAMAQRLYAAGGPRRPERPREATPQDDDDVVEAEIVDDEDDDRS
jgi:hypothetical protein